MSLMKMILGALAAALLFTPALAAETKPAATEQVTIPYPSRGIRHWEAERDRVLYVLDWKRRWYRVELMRPCLGIQYAYGIAFDTRGQSRIDRFSSVLVRGQRCPINSIARSGPPEPRAPRSS